MQALHLTDKTIVEKAHPWTLPPSTVTVVPRSPDQFWEAVRQYAAEVGNWDLVERLSPCSPIPACQKPVNIAAEAPVTFPVFKAAAGTNQHDEHNPIAWKVVQDLQNKAQKFGINSHEVMQLICIIATDLLCPYDITHLAQVLFQPVQFQVFQSTWRQIARAAAQHNLRLPQGDPRLGVGEDALLGEGQFSNPQLQATWPPIVLEQAQQVGIMALKRTMELAAPKQKYTAIHQGPKEPFLQFVEKISAALDKQVEDEGLRQMLCKQLAKDNANEDCEKIIQALPGDPSIPDMVAACSKVGTVEHKVSAQAAAQMAALATVMNMRHSGKCFGCGKEGHIKAACLNRTSPGKQLVNIPPGTNCNKCGKPGHFGKQCHSKFHINGQPLQGNCKKSARGRAKTPSPLPAAGHLPSANNYQPQQLAQQGWMYPPPTQ
ncbi:endogenous retrovirus group K member 5 Gag polyprotein-like [Morphnus guianensis]